MHLNQVQRKQEKENPERGIEKQCEKVCAAVTMLSERIPTCVTAIEVAVLVDGAGAHPIALTEIVVRLVGRKRVPRPVTVVEAGQCDSDAIKGVCGVRRLAGDDRAGERRAECQDHE